jgi:uncharacterized membrane protein YhaH (DUF805 family)
MKSYLWNLFYKRINRRTYAVGLLLCLLFCYTLASILYFHGESFVRYVPNTLKIISAFVFIFVIVLISISLNLRREHDIIGEEGNLSWRNNSLLLGEGQKKENEYGKPPPPKIDFKGLFGF